jgi:hypothetical protein
MNPSMIEIGNRQFNASSLKDVTGGPTYCEMVYQDFIFEFYGQEAAQVWAWWISRNGEAA